MTAFLVRRLAVMVAVFAVITVIVFGLVHATPGDPVAMLIPPEEMNAASAEYLDQKRAELGLDRPLPLQYFSWLGDALRGDLGYSLAVKRPVGELILERVGPTVELMGLAILLSILVAIPLGILAAVHQNRLADYVATFLSLASVSIPSFFVAIIAIYIFSLKLGLLPSAGMSNPSDGSLGDHLRHLILPVTILGLNMAGTLTRYVRSSMITELQSDYVRSALAKGVPQRRMLFRHALRNALIPIITVIALFLPGLLGGAVVVEQIFSWPGMGQLAVTAVTRQDYAVIIAFALMVSVVVLLSNFLADLLYAVADPRVALS